MAGKGRAKLPKGRLGSNRIPVPEHRKLENPEACIFEIQAGLVNE